MTSFNDLINIKTDTDIEKYELNSNNNNKYDETLFTIDDNIPKDNLPFENIHYLDNTKIYNLTKTLGNYTLKMHQTTTLYYMIGLEKMSYNAKTIKTNNEIIHTNHYTNIGILSDHVGSGKSYCIMALLNESKSIIPNELPFRTICVGSSDITPKKYNKLDTNVLLVPHSLIGQWSKYLENSGLKYYVVQKAKDVYGLGDKNCKFNNDNSKESKETKETKESKKTKETKESKKTKETKETKETKTTIKKKIILKKKNETELIPDPVSIPDPEPICDPEPITEVKKSRSTKSDIKKKLENERTQINREIREYESIISELRSNPIFRSYNYNYRYAVPNPTDVPINNLNNEMERRLIQEQIDEVNKTIAAKYKKHSELNDSIKNCDLLYGSVTDGQIQLLNTYNIICNDPSRYATASNYIDDTLKEYMNNLSHINKEYVESLDVILVSDTFYNLFSLFITRDDFTVNRIIIDECNSIKGSGLLYINNMFTWLITSSINSVITCNGYITKKQFNNNGGYYNIREKTIMSTGFVLNTIAKLYDNKDNYKLFLINNPEYIKKSILLPEMKTFVIICKDNVVIQVLNGIVSNDIMRMLNAGDIEGIISKIDAVSGDETNIISIITQKYNDDLLVKEYELKVAIENPKYKADTESLSIINKRIAIKDLKYKISCIEDRVKNADSCPICIDDFINPVITPCCNNKYCFNCITLALNNKNNCPSCRNILNISKLLVLTDKPNETIKNNDLLNNSIELKTYIQKIDYFKSISINATKYENMDKIFELNNENLVKKYLIFTEYESTLNTKITSILEKWNLKYDRIRGSSATINKQLEKYKNTNGETNVLLVNSKFFGSGMNLENTTDIIIMHKMQSDIEMQAIGRAQRFGREGELRVWKLYYQNETN